MGIVGILPLPVSMVWILYLVVYVVAKVAYQTSLVLYDSMLVDVTDIPCAEGDRVVIFGQGDLLQRNAQAANTIPYELLTAVSPRVKRVFYHEE